MLQKLRPSVGDRLKIGEADFVMSGVLLQEPDRSVGIFLRGPRAPLSPQGLAFSRLVRPGHPVHRLERFPRATGVRAEAFKYEYGVRLSHSTVLVTAFFFF